MIKAYFREGINSPIELLLMDGRIINSIPDSILGALNGNLIYQKLKFKVNTNFTISRVDRNISDTLMLYHKLKNIKTKDNSKTIRITVMVGIIFATEHNIYKKAQRRITIDKNFMPILQELELEPSQITIPKCLEIELDRTIEYERERPQRIEYNNTIGQRSLRIGQTLSQRSFETQRTNIIRTSSSRESFRSYNSCIGKESSYRHRLAKNLIRPISNINLIQEKHYINLEVQKEGIWKNNIAIRNRYRNYL